MTNDSFRTDFTNPDQNAVVGPKWPGDLDHAYREGFREATQALLATAATGWYVEPKTGIVTGVFVDALVYPICFNARHFIELFLKDSIRAISALGRTSGCAEKFATHDIADLWKRFAEVIKRDHRLVEFGMPLQEYFKDVAEMDATGETFRYSRDLDEQVHLQHLEHINLGVLGERLDKMFKLTETFEVCIEVLELEYAQGTQTNKLNRSNLEAIARKLPKYPLWSTELPAAKEAIMLEFDLSSNDFGKALNMIKEHREFSSLIGRELPLEGLPVDVFERLKRVHDEKAATDLLTLDEWYRLDSVLEVGRGTCYSEYYDENLRVLSHPDYDGYFDPLHVARNAYARNQRLREGLDKMGQTTLLHALAQAIPHLAEPLKRPPPRSKEEIEAAARDMLKRLGPKQEGDIAGG